MNWLDEVKKVYFNQKEFEHKREHHLNIEDAKKIPDDLTNIEAITLFHDYEGPSPENLLPIIIEQAPRLKRIVLSNDITWTNICKLDLSKIEELSFSLDGEINEAILNAPFLKKLTMFGNTNLTPIELEFADVPHLNFSRMSNLEELELRRFQLVCPDDFKHLHELRKLVITGSTLKNLTWLADSEYLLTSLWVDAELEDCSGLLAQSKLEKLSLNHTTLKDVSPIKNLSNLKKLNLRYSDIENEDSLRQLNLEELVITDKDADISSAQRKIHDLIRISVLIAMNDEKQFNYVDELPEGYKKVFLKKMQSPFEDRIKQSITWNYREEIKKFDKPGYYFGSRLSKDEYLEAFQNYAFEYCPFIPELLPLFRK